METNIEKKFEPNRAINSLTKCVGMICVTIVVLVFLFIMHFEYVESQKTEQLKLMIEASEKGVDINYER